MPTNLSTDRQQLTQHSYKTNQQLNVRIRTHKLYTQPDHDFVAWVLDQVAWEGDERVLDVGCGAGVYTAPAAARCGHYIAGDLSFGMVAGLPAHVTRLNLDVQTLSFQSACADVILANHMLYHVPDLDAALIEIRRVLKPTGRLIAATNSEENMAELEELQQAIIAQRRLSAWPARPVKNFSLENGGERLGRHFSQVVRHDLPSALVFPGPQPIIDYVASTRDWYERILPAGRTWEADVEAPLRAKLDAHFAQHDVYRISKLAGVFICTP